MAVAMTAALGFVALPAGAQVQPVSPRAWVLLSEGLALTQAGRGYAGALMHVPSVGGGIRLTDTHGIEVSAALIQSIFGNEGGTLIDPRPLPPNQAAFSGSWVTIRGSSRVPFAAMGALGSGAYREAGSGRMNLGVHGYIGTAVHMYSFGALASELRLIAVPNSSAGRMVTLAITGTMRSR